jgi:hypothetical protein
MPSGFLQVTPRNFNPMSVPGLTQEAGDGVNAALKAMSSWRNAKGEGRLMSGIGTSHLTAYLIARRYRTSPLGEVHSAAPQISASGGGRLDWGGPAVHREQGATPLGLPKVTSAGAAAAWVTG